MKAIMRYRGLLAVLMALALAYPLFLLGSHVGDMAGEAFFPAAAQHSSVHSDLKVEVATFNVTAPKCDKHNRCAGINWSAVQDNISGMERSMEEPKNFDVKSFDYDALQKAGLLAH